MVNGWYCVCLHYRKMDVWFAHGVSLISVMVLTTQGTTTIQTVPSTIIQGESASIKCTTSGYAVIEKFDVTSIQSNFSVITSCFLDETTCGLSNDYVQYTISKTNTSVSVNIANVSRDRDGGVWKCTANANNTAVTIDIDVKVPVPFVTIISNNTLTFTNGSNTDVSCKSGVSYPHATIKWSINGGNNLGNGTTSNNSDGTTTSILQYTADKSDHNKILQCTATNGYGTNKTDSITLNIRFLPKVHIQPITSTYKVVQGKQVMLNCSVDDANPLVPSDGFTWSKNGIDVTGRNSSIYRMETVQRSDKGSFTCTGRNSVGPGTSTAVQVDVLYPPIVSTPSTYQVIESTDLTLQCTAIANPGNINYRWTGPGDLDSTGSSLIISNIGKDKSGVYTCTATNIMIPTALPQETGRGTSTTIVNVLYGPTVTISPDDNTKILENTDHRLTCTVQSNPTPTTFTWYQPNGTSIPGERELVISKRDQSGIYRCEANTTLVPTVGSPVSRSDSQTINITVLYLDPVMLTSVEDKQEGDNISITCSTNSSPVALITWYNGTTIISSKQTDINIFTIPHAACLDTGDYRCQATNTEIPSVQNRQSLTLLVKCSPRQDTRVITTSVVSGNTRDIVQLVADVISYPPPTFTWYYNNITTGDVEPIYNDDVFKQNDTNISINTYRSTLNISITSNIYYTSYTVNVSNTIGYTQLEYQVTVDPTLPPGPASNWGLIGGTIGGVVVAILVVVLVVLLIKRQRKQNGDTDNRQTVPLVEVPIRQPGGMIIDEVVNYISADEIKKDETATYAQVNKENKTTETKPNPVSLYATVNKTKNDETAKSIKNDVKPQKPDTKPQKPDTKPKVLNVKNKEPTNEKSTKSKGEAYENVGIFGDVNVMKTNEYENHSIKPGPTETVYADLDFDGHQPSTTVQGQDDAVEYSGIDYTKRGPTQTTPPDSSGEESDNRE